MTNVKQIEISDFLSGVQNACIIDVRSEGEYKQGHIPDAISFPLLNDEERKLVGTCYKERGNFEAVLLGYELVGPRFSQIIKDAKSRFGEKLLYVHCWRGGLRSKIMANLLSSAGFSVCILKGGYKNYRSYVHDLFLQPFRFIVLSGYTGSGKTDVLKFLSENGKQVIDLEFLANHRGSAFGGLGFSEQPSQEQFENNLAKELTKLDSRRQIWIEDESRLIGVLQVPSGIYDNYRKAGLYFMDIPLEKRSATILKDYGHFKKEELILSTFRIKKKLGDLRTRMAIEAIDKGDLLTWVKEVLYYYDKAYNTGLKSKNNEFIYRLVGDINEIKQELLNK